MTIAYGKIIRFPDLRNRAAQATISMTCDTADALIERLNVLVALTEECSDKAYSDPLDQLKIAVAAFAVNNLYKELVRLESALFSLHHSDEPKVRTASSERAEG